MATKLKLKVSDVVATNGMVTLIMDRPKTDKPKAADRFKSLYSQKEFSRQLVEASFTKVRFLIASDDKTQYKSGDTVEVTITKK